MTRKEIEGELWLNDAIPADVCAQNPSIQAYGVYRVVKCTSVQVHGCEHGEPFYEELLPYCSARVKSMLSADRDKVEGWLEQLSRPKSH